MKILKEEEYNKIISERGMARTSFNKLQKKLVKIKQGYKATIHDLRRAIELKNIEIEKLKLRIKNLNKEDL